MNDARVIFIMAYFLTLIDTSGRPNFTVSLATPMYMSSHGRVGLVQLRVNHLEGQVPFQIMSDVAEPLESLTKHKSPHYGVITRLLLKEHGFWQTDHPTFLPVNKTRYDRIQIYLRTTRGLLHTSPGKTLITFHFKPP